MAGTVVGGRKAAAKNKMLYGANYYNTIGKMGGLKSRGGGFANRPEVARAAGKKSGLSRQNKTKSLDVYPIQYEVIKG